MALPHAIYLLSLISTLYITAIHANTPQGCALGPFGTRACGVTKTHIPLLPFFLRFVFVEPHKAEYPTEPEARRDINALLLSILHLGT
jgi:hypothetical protein